MLPDHIFEVEEAYFWLEDRLSALPHDAVTPDPPPLEILVDPAGDPHALTLDDVRFHFGSYSTYLSVSFYIGPDLEPEVYRFDYRESADGKLIWRHDKHPGHEAEDGTDCHLHTLGPTGAKRREPVIGLPTLDEILGLLP